MLWEQFSSGTSQQAGEPGNNLVAGHRVEMEEPGNKVGAEHRVDLRELVVRVEMGEQ